MPRTRNKPTHKRTKSVKSPQFDLGKGTKMKDALIPFDDWVKTFHFDFNSRPLFEVVFPRKYLEQGDVYRHLYANKIKVANYGDEETVVAYFHCKEEAKDLRDVVRNHWKACHVSDGPLHRNRLST